MDITAGADVVQSNARWTIPADVDDRLQNLILDARCPSVVRSEGFPQHASIYQFGHRLAQQCQNGRSEIDGPRRHVREPTIVALMLAHIQGTPARPSVLAPAQGIPAALEAVVMRALAKRPEDRFPDAPAMAGALSAALATMPARDDLTQALPPIGNATIRTAVSRLPQPGTAMGSTPASTPPSPSPAIAFRPSPGGVDRLVPIALMLLVLVAGGVGGAALVRQFGGNDPPDDDARPIVAEFDPTATATGLPVATRAATETPVPTPTETPRPEPTETPQPEPTETPLPTEIPVPTETPTPEPTETPLPPTIVPRASVTSLDFAASDWEGAYFQEAGNMRPWSAVYAESTGYGEGTLRFTLDGEPAAETFQLTVDGMTSENWNELPIAILINGTTVYEGNSPFPTWNGVDGEQPWRTVRIELPAAALQSGDNTITFVNGVEDGEFSRPPYILLASGTVTVEVR